MSYNSKYTGQQVEALLDIVSQGGGTGGEGGEVQKTTEAEILAMGFTKNEGTITEVKMNGVSKGTSGVVDLGTVITEHQDISGKVDKVTGKQLSTEDFTTALKQKLEGLSNYNDTEINAAVSALQTQLNTLVSGNANDAINSFNEIIAFLDGIKDSQDLSSIIASIEQQIASKMDKVTLANVATSGSYNDLIDKPTIPSAVTESTVSGWGFTKNTGTYSKPSGGIPKTDLASAVQTSLGKADTALQSYTEQYKGTVTGVKINGTTKNPSSGVVDLGTVITSHQDISGKQDKLVSGTNIKTINGTSILGSGNIVIEGGSSGGGSESPIFLTHFSIHEFISGYVPFTDEQRAAIRKAASQNKIIAIPYSVDGDYTGFTVATYYYSHTEIDGEEYWRLDISVIYNDISYGNSMNQFNIGFTAVNFSKLSFTAYGEGIEVDENGIAYVDSDIDDSTFLVLGECRRLCISVYVGVGVSVRFFTGEDCTLEMPDTYWANGVIPTIEPYTHYELSMAVNVDGWLNSVLIPFKSVEQ